ADLPPADPERVAGKLVYKDSPFSGWVQDHVSAPARNALCVEDASELYGEGLRVTLAGQTRQGRRGAHALGDMRNLIGFSNDDALAAPGDELRARDVQLVEIDGVVADLARRTSVLEQRRTAYDAIAGGRYADLDVGGSDRRIADPERRRAEILSSD